MRNRSTILIFLTGILVLLGCALYVNESVGWAQMLWVLASGTAGAGVVAWLDEHPESDGSGNDQ